MALEAITDTINNGPYIVELLASATATNSAPTGTAGISTDTLWRRALPRDKIRVAVNSTAGSGTMTVTLRVWLRAGGIWFVAKALNASTAAPHTAVAIPETGTDTIAWSEEVTGLTGASRIYLEIVAIAGTSTAVTGYAIVG